MATNAQEPGWLSAAVSAQARVELALRQWKQVELATRSGIPQPTMSGLLAARKVINLNHLEALAAAFDLEPDEIVTRALALHDSLPRPSRDLYLPDGKLDPAQIEIVAPSDEDMERAARRRPKRNPR